MTEEELKDAEESNRLRGASFKSMWREVFNLYVEALDSRDTEKSARLRIVLDKTMESTIDDNTRLLNRVIRSEKGK